MKKMYYKSFHIAGFSYYEGPEMLRFFKQIGTELKLKAEPKNRYDENAVAIYYKKDKIGYVPRDKNYSMSKFLRMGHNPFRVTVHQVLPNESLERQVRVAVSIRKNNSKAS